MKEFRKIPTHYGAIIEDGDLVGFGHFKSNGFWIGEGGKRITSYFRIEDGDEDNPDVQYSMIRRINEEGKAVKFFFIETYDGADFKAYIEGIKAQKNI